MFAKCQLYGWHCARHHEHSCGQNHCAWLFDTEILVGDTDSKQVIRCMAKIILDCNKFYAGNIVMENKPKITFLGQIL